MALKLTIDEGNTSTKLALWDADNIVESASYNSGWEEAVKIFMDGRDCADMAILCSVRDCDLTAAKRLLSTYATKPLILSLCQPMSMPLGISLYKTPDTLGADRIAAAAGARTLFPGQNLLVADIGTAVTYDIVFDDGNFGGGNITPGIDMRLKALNVFTERLPSVSAEGDIPPFGYDTATAMRAGAVRGVAAETEYFTHLYTKSDAPVKLILTGGGASTVAPFLKTSFIHEPNLVMIGLNSILDYNAKTI